MSNAKYSIDNKVYELIEAEHSFALIARMTSKRWDEGTKTAAVFVKNAQFNMVVNPKMFEKISDSERLGIIKHELLHLLLGHLTYRFDPKRDQKKWNYATDLAINCHIPNLPEWTLLPGREPFESFAKNLSAEDYYDLITDDQMNKMDPNGECDGDCANCPVKNGEAEFSNDGTGKKCKHGNGMLDDHSQWGNGESDIGRKEAQEKLGREIARNADKFWGKMSADIKKDFDLNCHQKINWRQLLRSVVGTSIRSEKKSTVRRISRKYPSNIFGTRVERLAKIAISVDESGSVSDEMMEIFFGEISNLCSIATFTVIPFDYDVAVDSISVWKKNQKPQKYERVLHGGTNFDAPTTYVNECDKKFDLHIILTDLYAPVPKESKPRRIWITVEGNYDKNFQTDETIIVVTKD